VKKWGKGAYVLSHPYATIINAKSIGDNFKICHLTTIGNKQYGRNDLIPTIGNNVSLGANVTIIGDITIGNNVIVGAGSVVVNDIPDNCVVVGNPARIVKRL
jgi:serine acetyltransferase